MPGGRPPNWSTPDELRKDADAYFKDTQKEKWTITGLALALKTTRQTLCEYNEKDQFTDTIKEMKTKVENAYEESLRARGNAGDIFGLKNFGWRDKTETDITTAGEKLNTELTPAMIAANAAAMRAYEEEMKKSLME